MIELKNMSYDASEYSSLEEFYQKYQTDVIESYEEFIEQGHSWCWCLVGNIVQEHEFGEEHEIKYGTKQFSCGAKVYLAPAQWGDGYENIVVIGQPRKRKKLIEVITHSKYVENYRMKKVYSPAVLKRMCLSKYRWWGDTDKDREEIIEYLETRSPEEAQKQKQLLKAQNND